MPSHYHPELDITQYSNLDDIAFYQNQISILHLHCSRFSVILFDTA